MRLEICSEPLVQGATKPVTKKDWRAVAAIVKEKLAFDALRPGQHQALEAVLQGRDTLAVLPTGSGKSAIYQIAGLMIEGPTVVVSPLIALQRDQREAIEQGELGTVALLNSLEPAHDRAQAFEELESAELEFLLLAPEQFDNPASLLPEVGSRRRTSRFCCARWPNSPSPRASQLWRARADFHAPKSQARWPDWKTEARSIATRPAWSRCAMRQQCRRRRSTPPSTPTRSCAKHCKRASSPCRPMRALESVGVRCCSGTLAIRPSSAARAATIATERAASDPAFLPGIAAEVRAIAALQFGARL